MFPNGWPGRGLLLLRVTNASLVLSCFITNLRENVQHLSAIFLITLGILAILLLVGLWTPAVGILSALTIAPLLVQGSDDPRVLVCLIVFGISLSMLGPGAISIDAAIFGRKRLNLPDL